MEPVCQLNEDDPDVLCHSQKHFPQILCLNFNLIGRPGQLGQLRYAVNQKKEAREQFVQEIVDEVSEHMRASSVKAEVSGRVKHFFSIYRKMVNQDKTLDQIYDLFAVRIIVD